MALDVAKSFSRLLVPVYPADAQLPLGPLPFSEVGISLVIAVTACSAVGFWLTRSQWLVRLARRVHSDLREEALEEDDAAARSSATVAPACMDEEDLCKAPRTLRKRTAQELLFIAVHNGFVASLSIVAWLFSSRELALHCLCLEVSYQVFDSFSLGLSRLEPETLIHHLVSPICILCSTQTDVDFRVLCHLGFCIDSSGAILGYSKFLLRYSHKSAKAIYQRLIWVHGIMRVLIPLIDTAIIVHNEIDRHGSVFATGTKVEFVNGRPVFAKTDWTHLYFWSMAVMTAFNCYFFYVIRARARLPASLCTHYEVHVG